MAIVYKAYAYSNDLEIVGYDVALTGKIVLFTEQQLADIKKKPVAEQETYAMSLVLNTQQ